MRKVDVAVSEALASATDADAAERYINRIRNARWRLRDDPESAPARDDIQIGLRGVTIGSPIALYRIADDTVEIVRVVHGACDRRGFAGDFV